MYPPYSGTKSPTEHAEIFKFHLKVAAIPGKTLPSICYIRSGMLGHYHRPTGSAKPEDGVQPDCQTGQLLSVTFLSGHKKDMYYPQPEMTKVPIASCRHTNFLCT